MSDEHPHISCIYFPKVVQLELWTFARCLCNFFLKYTREETIFYFLYIFLGIIGQKRLGQPGAQPLGGGGGAYRPLQFLNQTIFTSFSFKHKRYCFFMGVQKLYEPEISRFLPCMLQFLENLHWLFIFFNCIREIDHFMLDLLKRFDT